MSAPTTPAALAPVSESVIPEVDRVRIADHTRIRQLETLLAAETATSARLRTQRDKARHAGSILLGQVSDLERQLAEAQELIRAQALSLDTLTNRVRKADQALGKLTQGAVRA